tara:strand:- start:703 stop:837 length:135 start_codon:yes stop_codon:yes gene_type:complete
MTIPNRQAIQTLVGWLSVACRRLGADAGHNFFLKHPRRKAHTGV